MPNTNVPTVHGIDLNAPGGVEALLDFHYNLWGDATMEAGAGDSGEPGDNDDDAGSDKGFPADTPVAQMTPTQQVAYWKDKARKHEERARNAVRPSEHQQLKDELEQLRQSQLSDQERNLEEAKSAARAEGKQEAAAALQRELVIAKLQIATQQDEAALKYLDHTAFLTESGEVDTDKVSEYATQAAPAKTQRQKDLEALGSMDAGKRGTHDGGKPSVESGRERFRERHNKS